MHFAIDIDQTIAGANAEQVYIQFYNRDLHLGLDETMLQRLTYKQFFEIPQVLASYRADRAAWNASRKCAIETPEVLSSFLPMPGASDGVKQLSRYGSVGYYTARSDAMQDVTQYWLDQYGFSGELFSCGSIEKKLITLARKEVQERIYLIDDRAHTHILSEIEKFKDNPDIVYLREWLTLVAFGQVQESLPQISLCPLIALPSWKDVDAIVCKELLV